MLGADLLQVGDVAFDDVEFGVAAFPGGTQSRIAFDGEEAGTWAEAWQDGFRESTGAGAKFDDDLGAREVKRVGEMAGEEGGTGADGGDGKGIAGEFAEDKLEIAAGFCLSVLHLTSLYQVTGLVLAYLVNKECV